MERNFCFNEIQVERLSQLVKHELVCLNVLKERSSLSDVTLSHLNDEYEFYDSILDVLLNRG